MSASGPLGGTRGTPGRRAFPRSFAFAPLVVAGGLVALVSCTTAKSATPKPSGDATVYETESGTFTRADVLASIAACTYGIAREAAVSARAFEAACTAAVRDPSDTNREATKAAYAAIMISVQKAEIVRLGPYGPKTSPGGEDTRAHVYAWPALNPCLVDETLVSKGYAAGDFVARSLVAARGLGAAESLVHRAGAENACAPTSVVNTEGTWAAVAEPERAARRREYLAVVAKDVSARLEGVAQKWDPAGGDFSRELAKAGAGSRHFGSQQIAINAIVDALFYLESDLKDQKLGRPLAKSGCTGAACAKQVESVYAKLDMPWIRANLEAFSQIFFGCGEGGAGIALDDLLEGLGAKTVSNDMRAASEEAKKAAGAITSPSLEDAIAREPDKVVALHDAVRKMTDVLKVEVLSAFDLELPKRVEGDND